VKYRRHHHYKLCLFAGIILALPLYVLADYGYLTMPVDPATLSYVSPNTGINAWVDHSSPESTSGDASTTMTRFTGLQYFSAAAAAATGTSNPTSSCSDFNGSAGCYNGHEGIDFAVASGTSVFAAASGTVQQSQWQDPNNTTNTHNFGRFVRIWHSQYGISTLYAHLNMTSSLPGDTVTRTSKIGESGDTGCVPSCHHLHFQVYNANVTVTSSPPISNFFFANSVDPYGWSGAGGQASDTWTNDRPFGYMWASKAATSSVFHYVTSSYLMTANTTWNADQIYIIQDSLTVSSSATLTIKQGAVVKFNSTSSFLQVDGKLDVQGTSTDPVYFTSIWDDTVGGDTNDDATTTGPGLGNWSYIQLDDRSTTTIKNAVIRYGGNHAGGNSYADIYVNGGYISATSTVIASSTFYGLQVASGTVKVTTSTFSGSGSYGLFVPWNAIGNITITTSTFTYNGGAIFMNAAAQIDFSSGVSVTSTGNTGTGNAWNGFLINSNPLANLTLSDTIPYIFNSLTLNSTNTLTLNPGVVVKFVNQVSLIIDGTLNVKGTTSTNPVYFTSLQDDSVGGDTNNDGTTTSAATGDWGTIHLDGGSSSTLNYAMVRYGGHWDGVTNADVYMGGGKLTVWHSTIASSSNYGIQVTSGTLTIASSTLRGDGTTSTLAIFNSTNMSSSVTAKQNYWNASSGPYNATGHSTGTGDGVDDHVNFVPWLTSVPL
jgi:hypothetical protein